MQLSEMIGQVVGAWIPMIDKLEFQSVKIHGVEAGGVWIESQTLTNTLLTLSKVQTSPKTAVFFLPYHEIKFLATSLDVPSLGEEGFGVTS